MIISHNYTEKKRKEENGGESLTPSEIDALTPAKV